MKAIWVIATMVISAHAVAQYKYTDADGRTVYSDTPPPANAKQVKSIGASVNFIANKQALSAKLGALQAKSPVVIYTAKECGLCDQLRSYLQKRGIPYSEKTVITDEDFVLYKVFSTDNKFPLVTVGREKYLGFDESKLASLLDTAGYPTKSELLPSYQFAPGVPLAGGDFTRPAAPHSHTRSSATKKPEDKKSDAVAPASATTPVTPAATTSSTATTSPEIKK